MVRGLRKDRDSNPGYPQGYNGFRDRPDRPLRHLSLSLSRLRVQSYEDFLSYANFSDDIFMLYTKKSGKSRVGSGYEGRTRAGAGEQEADKNFLLSCLGIGNGRCACAELPYCPLLGGSGFTLRPRLTVSAAGNIGVLKKYHILLGSEDGFYFVEVILTGFTFFGLRAFQKVLTAWRVCLLLGFFLLFESLKFRLLVGSKTDARKGIGHILCGAGCALAIRLSGICAVSVRACGAAWLLSLGRC